MLLTKITSCCIPKSKMPYEIYYWQKGEAFNGRALAVHGMLFYTKTSFIFKDPVDSKQGPQSGWPSFTVPYIRCPDGTHIGQSVAVSIKVAKDVGLYPSGELNELHALQIAMNTVDMLAEVIMVPTERLPDEKRAKKWLVILEDCLAANGNTGFFIGTSITYTDFHVFMACYTWSKMLQISNEMRGPLLTIHYHMMKALMSEILI